jgi:hypothetical protein
MAKANQRRYFMAQMPNPNRIGGTPIPATCPFCGHEKISIELDIDKEPSSFKPTAECDKCGARGPTARSRDLGMPSRYSPVEREAAKRWNARGAASARGARAVRREALS